MPSRPRPSSNPSLSEQIERQVRDFHRAVEELDVRQLLVADPFIRSVRDLAFRNAIELSTIADDDRNCSICLEALEDHRGGLLYETHAAVKTPCGHIFGAECLWAWFAERKNSNCPICRRAYEFRPSTVRDWPESIRAYAYMLDRIFSHPHYVRLRYLKRLLDREGSPPMTRADWVTEVVQIRLFLTAPIGEFNRMFSVELFLRARLVMRNVGAQLPWKKMPRRWLKRVFQVASEDPDPAAHVLQWTPYEHEVECSRILRAMDYMTELFDQYGPKVCHPEIIYPQAWSRAGIPEEFWRTDIRQMRRIPDEPDHPHRPSHWVDPETRYHYERWLVLGLVCMLYAVALYYYFEPESSEEA